MVAPGKVGPAPPAPAGARQPASAPLSSRKKASLSAGSQQTSLRSTLYVYSFQLSSQGFGKTRNRRLCLRGASTETTLKSKPSLRSSLHCDRLGFLRFL